ncbi:Protein of unknown function, partial [Gryllus bimaculatus]
PRRHRASSSAAAAAAAGWWRDRRSSLSPRAGPGHAPADLEAGGRASDRAGWLAGWLEARARWLVCLLTSPRARSHGEPACSAPPSAASPRLRAQLGRGDPTERPPLIVTASATGQSGTLSRSASLARQGAHDDVGSEARARASDSPRRDAARRACPQLITDRPGNGSSTTSRSLSGNSSSSSFGSGDPREEASLAADMPQRERYKCIAKLRRTITCTTSEETRSPPHNRSDRNGGSGASPSGRDWRSDSVVLHRDVTRAACTAAGTDLRAAEC